MESLIPVLTGVIKVIVDELIKAYQAKGSTYNEARKEALLIVYGAVKPQSTSELLELIEQQVKDYNAIN